MSEDYDRPPSIPDMAFWLVLHILFSIWSFGIGDTIPFIIRWGTFFIFFAYSLPLYLHPGFDSNVGVRIFAIPLYGLGAGLGIGLVGCGIGLALHMLGINTDWINMDNHIWHYCLAMLYIGASMQAFRTPIEVEIDLEDAFSSSTGTAAGVGMSMGNQSNYNSTPTPTQTPSYSSQNGGVTSQTRPASSTGHNPPRRMPHAISGAVITSFDGHFFSYIMKCDRCGNQYGSGPTTQPATENRFGFGSQIGTAFHCQKCGHNQQVKIQL